MSIPPPPPPFGSPPYDSGSTPPGYDPRTAPGYGPGGIPSGYQPYQPGYGGQAQFAGFWSRVGGTLIDGLMGALFAIPAVVAFFASPKHRVSCTVNGDPGTCSVPTSAGWAAIIGLGALFSVAYLVIYCRMVGKGASWGQKAVGNRVVRIDNYEPIGTGKAVGRFFARYLSGFLCYLGYFWMLWDKNKQTWHDKMVGSIVIKG